MSRLFRVYFRDGNISLYGAENIVAVMSYVVYNKGYNATDIVKIEEVDE